MSVCGSNSSVLSGPRLVLFALPSCPHCRALLPAWTQLPHLLRQEEQTEKKEKEKQQQVLLAHVDCAEHSSKELCAGISSFPTIVWTDATTNTSSSSSSSSFTYHGPRDVSSLLLFVLRNSGPSVRRSSRWLLRDPLSAAVRRSAACEGDAADAFRAAAAALHRRFFFVEEEEEEAAAAGEAAEKTCVIEVVRMGGEERAAWSLEGNLTEFVLREATPLVSPFRKFVHATSKLPVVYLFHEGAAPSSSSLSEMREAARMVRSSGHQRAAVLFATVATSEWDGLRAGARPPYPAVVLVDTARLNHHYVYSGALRAADLAAWTLDFLEGRVTRTLVSEDEEPRRLPNGAARLVGSNWEREVLADDGRDVFVFFWSPHCGSSVGSRPAWEQLLAKLAGRSESRLLLAEADGWANDWNGIELSGLPDFRLFPADDKNHSKRYAGPRDADKMMEWLSNMAFNEISHMKEEL